MVHVLTKHSCKLLNDVTYSNLHHIVIYSSAVTCKPKLSACYPEAQDGSNKVGTAPCPIMNKCSANLAFNLEIFEKSLVNDRNTMKGWSYTFVVSM